MDSKVALARVVRAPDNATGGGACVVFTSDRGRLELRGRVDAEILRAMMDALISEPPRSSR